MHSLRINERQTHAKETAVSPSFTCRALSILSAGAALVACGGGADSSTPPPRQPTAPAGAPLTPAAPFRLTSTQSFAVLGWTVAPDASTWAEISADTVAFSWSATLGTYQLALKDAGSGSLSHTFPGNNPFEFTLRHEDGNTAPLGVMVRAEIRTTGRLFWFPLNGADLSTGIAAFGIAAAASDIPASGTRNFVGTNSTDYAPTLAFDLDAGRLTGKVRIAWEDAWGPYPAKTYDLSPAGFDRTTNAFSATFTVPGAPAQGSIRGMFMGPGAREVAIAWQSPIVDPYSSQWLTLRGVWLGSCTNCGN